MSTVQEASREDGGVEGTEQGSQHKEILKLKNTYRLIRGDCCSVLKSLDSESVDCVVTDPPYGLSFMGKDWDKALPPREAFSEMYRVLKSGALAFVMSSPRQDLLWRMMALLEGVGFELRQSPIYWAYASGFPKAMDVSKQIDKKLGVKRKTIGTKTIDVGMQSGQMHSGRPVNIVEVPNEVATSDLARRWDGWKSQTGLKPAVEVILMVNKPRSEKTIVDQVLKTGTGAMNVDACLIPFSSKEDIHNANVGFKRGWTSPDMDTGWHRPAHEDYVVMPTNQKGRFPANLLASDGVLDTGKTSFSRPFIGEGGKRDKYGGFLSDEYSQKGYTDEGGFSRYFSLDSWWLSRISKLPKDIQKTMPFLVVPKASKSERDEGLTNLPLKEKDTKLTYAMSEEGMKLRAELKKEHPEWSSPKRPIARNTHPTVKPLSLMCYLVTLGCPVGGTVLDPFVGQGTTLVASYLMGKSCIGIDIEEEYCVTADAKMRYHTSQKRLNREVEYTYVSTGLRNK